MSENRYLFLFLLSILALVVLTSGRPPRHGIGNGYLYPARRGRMPPRRRPPQHNRWHHRQIVQPNVKVYKLIIEHVMKPVDQVAAKEPQTLRIIHTSQGPRQQSSNYHLQDNSEAPVKLLRVIHINGDGERGPVANNNWATGNVW